VQFTTVPIADTAHKMRQGSDLRGFAVRPLNLAKSAADGAARMNTHLGLMYNFATAL
jgi:hypothetical protein